MNNLEASLEKAGLHVLHITFSQILSELDSYRNELSMAGWQRPWILNMYIQRMKWSHSSDGVLQTRHTHALQSVCYNWMADLLTSPMWRCLTLRRYQRASGILSQLLHDSLWLLSTVFRDSIVISKTKNQVVGLHSRRHHRICWRHICNHFS